MKLESKHHGTLLVRAGAWVALSWERLWPLAVPLVLVIMVFFSLSWLGIWERVPSWLHVVLLGGGIVAFLGALIPLRRFEFPAESEVSRRIEVETRLDDRPISAQVDDIALGEGDEFSKALWNEHRLRMKERLENLTGGQPRARGDRFDRYGLRLMLPILAFVAFMISFGADGGRVSDAFRLGGDPAKLLTRLDVWVNPPTYTRKAPVYLSVKDDHQEGQTLQIPQFSELVGRFAGAGDISMRFNDGEKETEIEADIVSGEGNSAQTERFFKLELTQSGEISVFSRQTKIAQWSLNIVEDTPPQIRFEEEPGAALSGSLQLSYGVKDDYGVVRARGIVEPGGSGKIGEDEFDPELPARFIAPPDARSLIEPLEIKLPLPRRQAKDGKTKVNRDNTKHPLAGSPVKLKLMAEDEAGQKGYSESKELILPGRNFVNPLARALIEQRRILALDANQQYFVVTMLDALMIEPEKFIDNFTAVLAMKVTYRKLVDARSDDELRDVLDLLWDVALGIEFGNISDVERRLREAQERLSEALENGASEEEIDRLMKELRQAMNEMMQALIEQARRNPQSQNPMMQDDNARTLRQRDLERMMDRIEDLAKSGSRDAARELLSEMQRMMDNLRAGRQMQQRQAEGNQMNQTLNQLSELMQEQQRLMDETFQMEQRRQQSQRNQQQQNGQQNSDQQNRNGQNQQQQQQQGEMTAQEFADALKQLQEQQQALQEQLSGLSQQLEELGLQPSGEFGEAGEQMGEAGEQLGQGETGNAAGNQGRALDALRRGAQSMMRQMAGDRQQGGRQQGQGNTGQNSQMTRDPLGRDQRDQGRGLDSSNTEIPDEIDAQRARQILDAIRKRLSQPQQRVIEKKYLERLLDSQ